MMSNLKSSIAEYKTSSIAVGKRCISSINSTSIGSRAVKIAAKSPCLVNMGADVARKFVPSSFATMCANVVLPNPGGPYNKTWSIASPRDFAPLINTDKFCFSASCPIKSDKVCGRMVAAISSGIFGSKKRFASVCMLFFYSNLSSEFSRPT